jgi:hypothetical protein
MRIQLQMVNTFTRNTQNGSIENIIASNPYPKLRAKKGKHLRGLRRDYPESIIPPSEFLLAESRSIEGKEAGSTISVVISSIPGVPAVSYENDVAPKGTTSRLQTG